MPSAASRNFLVLCILSASPSLDPKHAPVTLSPEPTVVVHVPTDDTPAPEPLPADTGEELEVVFIDLNCCDSEGPFGGIGEGFLCVNAGCGVNFELAVH